MEEQLLLFDLCKRHIKKDTTISKRYPKIVFFSWHYWNTKEGCDGCNLDFSIKMTKNIRSYLLKREGERRRDKKLSTIVKIRKSLRRRLGVIIKSSFKTPIRVRGKNKLVGCTNIELRNHLEQQWQPGMTWKNYGKLWHVDHIKPCSLFDVTKEEDLKTINHFTNLQPLWAEDNLRKSNKYEIKNDSSIFTL